MNNTSNIIQVIELMKNISKSNSEWITDYSKTVYLNGKVQGNRTMLDGGIMGSTPRYYTHVCTHSYVA